MCVNMFNLLMGEVLGPRSLKQLAAKLHTWISQTHPSLVNNLNVQGNLQTEGIAVCKGDAGTASGPYV